MVTGIRRNAARRTALGAVLALSMSVGIEAARAQDWPSRAVTVVVSQGGGSSPDVLARLLVDRIARDTGKTFIVENRAGGGNVIGANSVARAAPDGYTFFFATSAALVTNPFMMKNLPYKPLTDFTPVAMIARSTQMLVVNPAVKATTLAELIALDKAAPGSLSAGVDGPRSLNGVTVLALNKRAGTGFVLVPYTSTSAALQDIVAGRTHLAVQSISVVESFIRSGAVRAIATPSLSRPTAFPAVATIAETFPGFDFSGWFMMMAPANTPRDIVAKFNADIAKALKDETVRARAPGLGFELDAGGPPEAAGAFLKTQYDLWTGVARDLAIEPQ